MHRVCMSRIYDCIRRPSNKNIAVREWESGGLKYSKVGDEPGAGELRACRS